MSEIPPCPKCNSEHVYSTGALLTCLECAHEWNPADIAETGEAGLIVKDAN